MSSPVINASLPPSAGPPLQPIAVPSPPVPPVPVIANVPSLMPLAAPVKVTPPSPPINKPTINHTAAPISLVTENKAKTPERTKDPVQAPPAPPQPPAPPKPPAPTKPTSNGVEEPPLAKETGSGLIGRGPLELLPLPDVSFSAAENILSGSRPRPISPEPVSSMAPVSAPPEEISVPIPAVATVNHAEEPPVVAPAAEPEPAAQVAPPAPAAAEEEPAKPAAKPQGARRKRKPPPQDIPSIDNVEEGPEGKKPRRKRVQAAVYQAPLPEIASVIKTSLKRSTPKSSDEKLIVFFKDEFLAVRNADGGFYLCQSVQNINRTSHKIRIRWLSKDEKESSPDGGIFARDFYDTTEFECILTTVALQKKERNKYKLPAAELERVESILKRAIDVEKGVSEKPDVTEEHPDGLDVSLYRDESQLQKAKKTGTKRKSSPSRKTVSPKRSKKGKTKERHAAASPGPAKEKAKKLAPKAKPIKVTAKKTPEKKTSRSDRSAAREQTKTAVDPLKVSPPNEKARVVAKVLRTSLPTPPKAKSKETSKDKKKLFIKVDKPAAPEKKSERKPENKNKGKSNTTATPIASSSKLSPRSSKRSAAPPRKKGRK